MPPRFSFGPNTFVRFEKGELTPLQMTSEQRSQIEFTYKNNSIQRVEDEFIPPEKPKPSIKTNCSIAEALCEIALLLEKGLTVHVIVSHNLSSAESYRNEKLDDEEDFFLPLDDIDDDVEEIT